MSPMVLLGGPTGLQPACFECLARQLLPGQEAYQFQFTDPDRIVSWDVTRAYELVEARNAPTRPLEPAFLQIWLEQFANVNPEHLDHIPEAELARPGLLDRLYTTERLGDSLEAFPVLIDGSHRALWRLARNEPLPVHELTPDEHRQVVTIQPGRIAELLRSEVSS